jgi:Cell division protein CrgA
VSWAVASKSSTGPGRASDKGKSASGRTTAKGSSGNAPKANAKIGRYKTAEESGRYTKPIPKSVRHSSKAYGILVLALLIGGVAIIFLNYITGLPFLPHGSPWYLMIGLGVIFTGFLLATRYR